MHSNAVDDLYRSRSKRQATTVETSIIRPDTVCNQGGLHECVCNRSMGNLDDSLLICDRLLEVDLLGLVIIWGVSGEEADSCKPGGEEHQSGR